MGYLYIFNIIFILKFNNENFLFNLINLLENGL